MRYVLIAGGTVELDFVRDFLAEEPINETFIVACDKGYEACEALGVTPTFLIGDYDSADEGVVERAEAAGVSVYILNPVKNDTDVEAALSWVFDLCFETDDIYIIGGTGTRIDHMLGNIALLGMGLQCNRNVILLDSHNFIQMIQPGDIYMVDKKPGKYVSVIPYMGVARGVKMEGFKYPLDGVDVEGFNTLTISNEVEADQGKITIEDGYLIVVESRD